MQAKGSIIRTSTLTLDDMPVTIEVQRKRIRNIYLYVKPGARVIISAPLRFTDEEILAFARSKTDWLIRQLHAMQKKTDEAVLQYVTGETIRIWGTPHKIVFLPDKTKSLAIREDRVYLSMPADTDRRAREHFVKAQLKLRMHRALAMRLPVWEKETGLHARSFTVRDMRSRWGSCNIGTGRLTFSLELIRLDPICLDYIIVHELAHLRHARHNKAFWNLVGKYLPEWKTIRKSLEGPEDNLDTEETDAGD